MRRARLFAAMSAAAVVHVAAGAAHADVAPPPGRAWIQNRVLRVENVDQFPDWVVVLYPCGGEFGYCILRDEIPRYVTGRLYAIRTVDAITRGEKIVKPDIPFDGEEFLQKDRRFVQSNVTFEAFQFSTTRENSGVTSATYAVRIERITAEGIEVRFVRATYRCGNGATVEQAWGSDQNEPPIPACPATDDRSAVLGASEAGAGPAREVGQGPPDPIGARFPFGRAGLFWFGAAIASASLLGAGLLLGDGRRGRGRDSGA